MQVRCGSVDGKPFLGLRLGDVFFCSAHAADLMVLMVFCKP